MPTYPSEIPSADIKLLFDMLTGKTEANLHDVLQAGWSVQGYLQGLVWPVEEAPAVAAKVKFKVLMADYSRVPKLTDAQAVMALGMLVNKKNAKNQFQAQGLFDGLLGGGKLKGEVAKMLLPVLTGWIKKWVNGGGLENLLKKIIGEIA